MSQPSVVFIDDSATMREVIKIAFRRENIDVVTFADANSALAQIEQQPPDIVITDVIMPDRDGYDVCQHIKQHARLSAIPVILMSGVVNRTVADKAFGVKAAELIRKPFQPQDLITRVKHLLQPKSAAPVTEPATAAAVLSNIFATPQRRGNAVLAMPAPAAPAPAVAAVAHTAPRAIAESTPPAPAPQVRTIARPVEPGSQRIEVLRLEGLVKKLQSELAAEREYSRALEEHIKTLQESR